MKLRISAKALTSWAIICLGKAGLPDDDAEFVANSLVKTSLWGIDSHGIARLPHYLNRLTTGSLNPKPDLRFMATGPCTGSVNGDDGLGFVVCRKATQEALAMASSNGLGFVGVRESSHCGAIGLYGRMIAEKGFIGIVFTHSDSFVAPHRGNRKFLGTNPICITAPCADGQPICLDMATSAVAWNFVVNAQAENRPIPDGVAYDSGGVGTTDPNSVASLQPMAGHKGYALAFMIELLCGPLNGAPWGPHISPMYGDLSEKRHLGSFVAAIDPLRFFGGEQFSQVVREMADAARSQPSKDPERPVLVPGDDHYQMEKKRLADGIPIDPEVESQINYWCDKFTVANPLP